MRINSLKGNGFSVVKVNTKVSKQANIGTENFKRRPEAFTDPSVKEIADNDWQQIAEELKDLAIEIKNTRFEFSIHEETRRVIVRIYDKETNELLSEIPPEKFLDLIANIWKQVGLIIDKKV